MKGHRPNSNTLAIPVPDKEPAGRRSSGLAHLMSALHQNAAAVVNSKTQLNGPDQVKIQILKEKKFLVYFPWALDNFQNCLWPFSDLLKLFFLNGQNWILNIPTFLTVKWWLRMFVLIFWIDFPRKLNQNKSLSSGANLEINENKKLKTRKSNSNSTFVMILWIEFPVKIK